MAWRLKSVLMALLIGLPALPAAVLAQSSEVKREISQIAGELYRFQNNFHISVFLVTEEGVIATDPIDAEAAGDGDADTE